MNQEFTNISDHIEVVRRRIIPFSMTFLSVISVAILLATKLPATYESEATILIEGQEIPEEFVQSTVTTYADEQIQVIGQRVMTRQNLEKIAEQFNLFNATDSEANMDFAIEALQESIFVDPVRASVVDERTQRTGYVTIAFTVRFEHGNPRTTKEVTEQLALLFLQANATQRAELASETTIFLQAEAKRLDDEIVEMEARMAQFKELNKDTLPELSNLNYRQLERTERDLEQTERDIRATQERQALLRADLASVNPYESSAFGNDGELVSAEERLAALQRELLTKSSIYSEDHPDIGRLKREIALLSGDAGVRPDLQVLNDELESKRLELQDLQLKYSDDHPDIVRLKASIAGLEAQITRAAARTSPGFRGRSPDNPRYLQIQAQLEFIDQELAALLSQRQELRQAARSYRDRLARTPQTEREWLRITRNYDVSVEKYRTVRAQLDDAYRAQNLESEQKGERFSLLDPPRLPSKPIRPNRPFIFFAGFLFAVALSVGIVVVLETVDASVRNSKDVVAILGAPPLATLPVLRSRREISINLRIKIMTAFLFAAAIAMIVVKVV